VVVLLTISTTHEPATDLDYLLHKHPGRVQSFTESVGTAHVFYPEATERRCTAALLLEVDPVALVRGRKGPPGEGFALGQYVNDRPYAASSMLAMALKHVFRTALTGRHNVRFESLPPGTMRHRDHRFEWTRGEFRAWADRVAAAHGYAVRCLPVGADDPEVGPPTQMAVFSQRPQRGDAGASGAPT
jgi:hypothetical protein